MNNILIIGGNSGIGLETLKLLNNNGNNLFVASRKKPEVNFDFTYMQLDVESQKINPDFLPETLDGLVYFPGTINLKPFNRITKDDFLKELQINLK